MRKENDVISKVKNELYTREKKKVRSKEEDEETINNEV